MCSKIITDFSAATVHCNAFYRWRHHFITDHSYKTIGHVYGLVFMTDKYIIFNSRPHNYELESRCSTIKHAIKSQMVRENCFQQDRLTYYRKIIKQMKVVNRLMCNSDSISYKEKSLRSSDCTISIQCPSFVSCQMVSVLLNS